MSPDCAKNVIKKAADRRENLSSDFALRSSRTGSLKVLWEQEKGRNEVQGRGKIFNSFVLPQSIQPGGVSDRTSYRQLLLEMWGGVVRMSCTEGWRSLGLVCSGAGGSGALPGWKEARVSSVFRGVLSVCSSATWALSLPGTMSRIENAFLWPVSTLLPKGVSTVGQLVARKSAWVLWTFQRRVTRTI